jgi:hypothetical protein
LFRNAAHQQVGETLTAMRAKYYQIAPLFASDPLDYCRWIALAQQTPNLQSRFGWYNVIQMIHELGNVRFGLQLGFRVREAKVFGPQGIGYMKQQ